MISLTVLCFFDHPILTNMLTGDGAPGSPVAKQAQPKSQTKGKWLKITRKGLLVSAISRMGKIPSSHHHPLFINADHGTAT